MKQSAIQNFSDNISKLLNGDKIDLYESLIDSSFEYIAAEILSSQLDEEVWFDGTDDLTSRILSEDTIEFSGTMKVYRGQDNFWDDNFTAKVTYNHTRNDSMLIYVCIGELEAEDDLYKITFRYRNT